MAIFVTLYLHRPIIVNFICLFVWLYKLSDSSSKKKKRSHGSNLNKPCKYSYLHYIYILFNKFDLVLKFNILCAPGPIKHDWFLLFISRFFVRLWGSMNPWEVNLLSHLPRDLNLPLVRHSSYVIQLVANVIVQR